MTRVLKVDNVSTANQHLPVPLKVGEKVIVNDDDNKPGDQYIWVKHNKGQNKSRFFVGYFEKVSSADRVN